MCKNNCVSCVCNKTKDIVLDFGDVICLDNGEKHLIVKNDKVSTPVIVIDLNRMEVVGSFGDLTDVLSVYGNGESGFSMVSKFDAVFHRMMS